MTLAAVAIFLYPMPNSQSKKWNWTGPETFKDQPTHPNSDYAHSFPSYQNFYTYSTLKPLQKGSCWPYLGIQNSQIWTMNSAVKVLAFRQAEGRRGGLLLRKCKIPRHSCRLGARHLFYNRKTWITASRLKGRSPTRQYDHALLTKRTDKQFDLRTVPTSQMSFIFTRA